MLITIESDRADWVELEQGKQTGATGLKATVLMPFHSLASIKDWDRFGIERTLGKRYSPPYPRGNRLQAEFPCLTNIKTSAWVINTKVHCMSRSTGSSAETTGL